MAIVYGPLPSWKKPKKKENIEECEKKLEFCYLCLDPMVCAGYSIIAELFNLRDLTNYCRTVVLDTLLNNVYNPNWFNCSIERARVVD